MKRFLALFLALSMVLALTACGGKDTAEETTTAPTVAEDETTVAADVILQDSTAADETATAVESSNVSEEESSAEQATTEAVATTAADVLDLNNKQSIIDFYNAAVVKTAPDKPKGMSTMYLSKDMSGGGSILGMIVKFFGPVVKLVLENNSTESDWVPGEGKLRLDDCESVSATSKNGVVTVSIKLKSQTDDADGDPKNGGPVARGVGTLGSINEAANQLGVTFESGRDTVRLTYNNASINVQINEKTGKITDGTWKYTVDVLVGNAEVTWKSFTVSVVDLRASVDYQLSI